MNNPAIKSNLGRWQRLLLQNTSTVSRVGRGSISRFQPKNHHQYWNHVLVPRQRFLSSQSTTSTIDIVLKPWKDPMVEANGDYRKERYLEEHIGGPLYENQSTLPKLPIPTVEDTIDRFLPTALPLAKTKEEELDLKSACENFPEQAKLLQEKLIQRKEGEMNDTSWLQIWWNQLGYLQVRDTVVINVSYFLHFKDDSTVSDTEPNIQRAAALLFSTAEFRKLVCSGQLPAEKVGKKQTPLCSTAYKYMFNACRIPRLKQDSYAIYDPSLNSHAIIARKGHFFAIELVDPQTHDPLPVTTIEDQLKQCIQKADEKPASSPKLGMLTSNNRDDWAKAREKLLALGGEDMEKALNLLQSGAVMVNLDEELPRSRTECGEIFLSGGIKSGENRWFDKSIQLVVTDNGKSAATCEHSMMDGMPVVNYAGYIAGCSYDDVKKRSSESSKAAPEVVDIFEDVLDKIDAGQVNTLENEARGAFKSLISKQSSITQSFQAYGSDFIKKAGHSPDAYVQVAMQLATYRLFGEQAGTYEATQVRPFLHGRTETTRSVSSQSAAFVQKMGPRPKMDEHIEKERETKLSLLKEATEAHVQYTRLAAGAQGVDRHFFGLSMLVDEDTGTPALFDSPVFARSKRWRVSTSHLTHPNFVNWGFGQVVPDGVGIAYSINPRSCIFNVTALQETGWTTQLSDLLEEALLEMQTLVDSDSPPPSKL